MFRSVQRFCMVYTVTRIVLRYFDLAFSLWMYIVMISWILVWVFLLVS